MYLLIMALVSLVCTDTVSTLTLANNQWPLVYVMQWRPNRSPLPVWVVIVLMVRR